jgi:hypothetical protein
LAVEHDAVLITIPDLNCPEALIWIPYLLPIATTFCSPLEFGLVDFLAFLAVFVDFYQTGQAAPHSAASPPERQRLPAETQISRRGTSDVCRQMQRPYSSVIEDDVPDQLIDVPTRDILNGPNPFDFAFNYPFGVYLERGCKQEGAATCGVRSTSDEAGHAILIAVFEYPQAVRQRVATYKSLRRENRYRPAS